MSVLYSYGIQYGASAVQSQTQYSYALRYKGNWTASSSAQVRGAGTDEPNSSGTGIPAGGQGLAIVGFDYWMTWNRVDGYGAFTSYWDYVRINMQRVQRQFHDSYGNYVKLAIYHEADGGAHIYTIKYFTME